MKKGRYSFGLMSFSIFAFFSFAVVMAGPACKSALAADQHAVEPEGVSNGSNGLKVKDPYEHFNREVFKFNDSLYFHVLKPVCRVYSDVLPAVARKSIRNGFHNLVFPSRFINFMLQGRPEIAADEGLRFIINSTLGVAGMVDIAQARFGLESHEADFGQTLGVWGVHPGPFLIVPVLGPSDPRDLFGFGADSAMDPLFWLPVDWYVSFTAETGKYINSTSLHIGEYEELKKASLDPYVAMRNAYMQYRAHVISKARSSESR